MKNKVSLVGMFGIMLAFGIMIIGCQEPEHEPRTRLIKYQVTSTWSDNLPWIGYGDSSHEMVFLGYVELPWEKTLSASSAMICLTVPISGQPEGHITAKIFIDGIEVRSATNTDSRTNIELWYN